MIPTLAEFQHDFYTLAFGPPEAQARIIKANPPFEALPTPVIEQYQWMVFANVADTLETIFPFTYRLLEADWPSLVAAYLQAHPPTGYQLYTAAIAFPDFVEKLPCAETHYPFLGDLAAYELLEATLLRAPNAANPPGKSLSQLPSISGLATHAPIINPIGQAFSSWYNIPALAAQLSDETTPLDALVNPNLDPVTLWLYRDDVFRCRFLKVSPLVQGFLAACVAKTTASEGAATTYRSLLNELSETAGEGETSHMRDERFLTLLEQLLDKGILWGSVPVIL